MDFALAVLKFSEPLYERPMVRQLAQQLVDCGTSVGANYRGACRGRSRAEFVAKLGVAIEESDESMYWLELLQRGGYSEERDTRALMREANELTAIFVASRRTAKGGRN